MKAYSFLNTILLVNGVEITGWAKGDDVIKITRRTDSASDEMGAGGNMMVSISADKSGEVAIKLQQTSASNKFLMSLIANQEAGAHRFAPVQVMFQDTFRNDLAVGTKGYMKKPSDLTRGQQGGNNEWVFVIESLDMLLGSQGDL